MPYERVDVEVKGERASQARERKRLQRDFYQGKAIESSTPPLNGISFDCFVGVVVCVAFIRASALSWMGFVLTPCGDGAKTAGGIFERMVTADAHTMPGDEHTSCRQHHRRDKADAPSPTTADSTAVTPSWGCWCSSSTSVADLPLLVCCPPGTLSLFRCPASTSDCALAYTRCVFARILRPIRAEMAENETI